MSATDAATRRALSVCVRVAPCGQQEAKCLVGEAEHAAPKKRVSDPSRNQRELLLQRRGSEADAAASPAPNRKLSRAALDAAKRLAAKGLALRDPQGQLHPFAFDLAFCETASNYAVFAAACRPLVEDALLGARATFVAYGYAGTGKSHTLGLDAPLSEDPLPPSRADEGAVALSLRTIFRALSKLPPSRQWRVRVAVMAITHTDAFDPSSGELRRVQLDESAGASDARFAGLSRKYCEAYAEAARFINRCRETTRRALPISHFVIIATVETRDSLTQERTAGKLCFVDLAGVRRSCNSPDAPLPPLQPQCIATNTSLSCFRTCLVAIARNASSVPIDESQLTRVLRDYLSLENRTCLMVTLSAAAADTLLTHHSLTFAKRVFEPAQAAPAASDHSFHAAASRTAPLQPQAPPSLRLSTNVENSLARTQPLSPSTNESPRSIAFRTLAESNCKFELLRIDPPQMAAGAPLKIPAAPEGGAAQSEASAPLPKPDPAPAPAPTPRASNSPRRLSTSRSAGEMSDAQPILPPGLPPVRGLLARSASAQQSARSAIEEGARVLETHKKRLGESAPFSLTPRHAARPVTHQRSASFSGPASAPPTPTARGSAASPPFRQLANAPLQQFVAPLLPPRHPLPPTKQQPSPPPSPKQQQVAPAPTAKQPSPPPSPKQQLATPPQQIHSAPLPGPKQLSIAPPAPPQRPSPPPPQTQQPPPPPKQPPESKSPAPKNAPSSDMRGSVVSRLFRFFNFSSLIGYDNAVAPLGAEPDRPPRARKPQQQLPRATSAWSGAPRRPPPLNTLAPPSARRLATLQRANSDGVLLVAEDVSESEFEGGPLDKDRVKDAEWWADAVSEADADELRRASRGGQSPLASLFPQAFSPLGVIQVHRIPAHARRPSASLALGVAASAVTALAAAQGAESRCDDACDTVDGEASPFQDYDPPTPENQSECSESDLSASPDADAQTQDAHPFAPLPARALRG